jgi:hypothetical protein
MKSGNLNFLEPSGPLQACNGTTLAFYKVNLGYLEKRHNSKGLVVDVTELTFSRSKEIWPFKNKT